MLKLFIHLDNTDSGDKAYSFTKEGEYYINLKNFNGTLMVDIQGKGIKVYVRGLYIGKKKNVFTLKTIQKHTAPGSFSDLLVKGVFYDESQFTYEGLIRIEKDAQKTHAYQKNQNLVLSQKVVVNSRPFLEILANDVFCTHGSTTGGLNKEQLYYLSTRGLSEKLSEKLLVKGFIKDVTF